ncbi:hypothetical protein A1351_22455 [Methylosinus sp. R-45379]|nr:hypothetical protein A1351_22455 [Methylosinus sp. R-45379]
MASVLGAPPPGRPQIVEDDEHRKATTTDFIEGKEFHYWDNIHDEIKGRIWTTKITLPIWTDRILGGNTNANIPNRAAKVVTGNKMKFSDEMERRTIFINQFFKGDPKKRDPDSFKHKKLMKWTLENRHRLVEAALIIVQAWIAAGKPAPKNVPHFASFESYAEVIGGILENAGVPGFLENQHLVKAAVAGSNNRSQYEMLITAWLLTYGPNAREVGNPENDAPLEQAKSVCGGERTSLISLAIDNEIDLDLPLDKPGKAQCQKMGYVLGDMSEQSFEPASGLDVMVIPGGKRNGSNIYGLECVGYQPEKATELSHILWVILVLNKLGDELLAAGDRYGESVTAQYEGQFGDQSGDAMPIEWTKESGRWLSGDHRPVGQARDQG